MPTWYLTLLLYFIGATAYSLEQRKLAQVTHTPLTLLPGLLLALVVYPLGIIIALWQGNFWFHYTWESFALLAAASLFIAIYNVTPFRISKHIDATQFVIVMNLYTPVAVILGIFLLKESFGLSQFVGMFLLLFGAIIVAVKGFSKKSFRFDRYTGVLALSALFLGTGLVAEKAALSYMSPSVYLIYGWGLQFALTLLFAKKEFPYIKTMTMAGWMEIGRAGLYRAGLAIGYYLSIVFSKNVALIATATSFRIPLVFLASYLLLKERDHLVRRLIGVGIATVGLLLL